MSGGLFTPPIPHDPACPFCQCSFHHFLDCECGCTRHDRPGIYDEE